jgi:acetyl-CoA acetyltransferase
LRATSVRYEKTNPNGGGIGLAHPIGATTNIVTVKAL